METRGPSRRGGSAWEAIEYSPAPTDRFVAPEHHWPAFMQVALTIEQRHALNNLALRFSCEMVAHFERYVVDYLEQRAGRLGGALPERAVAVFAQDERNHIAAFLRLLAALRPGAYVEQRLRFFRWSLVDRLIVFCSPAVTFFVATDLLEEQVRG